MYQQRLTARGETLQLVLCRAIQVVIEGLNKGIVTYNKFNDTQVQQTLKRHMKIKEFWKRKVKVTDDVAVSFNL